MVVPDYNDFVADPGDLRKAFHTAISLFHLHDWVYMAQGAMINQNFSFNDQTGTSRSVTHSKAFANSLEIMQPNFALVTGLANAAKHLSMNGTRPHPDAPSDVAKTASQSLGCGEGKFGMGPYGGTPQVMLEGAIGHLHFTQIAEDVLEMWKSLARTHGWIDLT